MLKKTFTNAGHIDAKLIDFSEICQKKPQRNRLFFTDCFLAKFFPEISREIGRFSQEILRKLFAPENPSKIDSFLLKSREMGRFFYEFWLFSRENRLKSADRSANFDFFPAKIPRNQPIFPWICPWKSCEILLFLPRNIRSPVYCFYKITFSRMASLR